MHRTDCGDRHHMGAHHLRQGPDLAGMVHTDLEYGTLCFGRHPRQRQRHADVVVIGLHRSMSATCQPQARLDRARHTGLAD